MCIYTDRNWSFAGSVCLISKWAVWGPPRCKRNLTALLQLNDLASLCWFSSCKIIIKIFVWDHLCNDPKQLVKEKVYLPNAKCVWFKVGHVFVLTDVSSWTYGRAMDRTVCSALMCSIKTTSGRAITSICLNFCLLVSYSANWWDAMSIRAPKIKLNLNKWTLPSFTSPDGLNMDRGCLFKCNFRASSAD